MPDREARTYQEIALKPEVVQRGIDLVAPLARILLRRAKTVKGFHGRTTDAEWDSFEKEFNITIPGDYKLLTNTVGSTGLWFNGFCKLTTPKAMGEKIKELQERYPDFQLDEMKDAYVDVGIWPGQPAFHLEWGRDVGGTAMSHFWCCAKSKDGSVWPVVQMQLEAPLEHNGGIHPCTATEALYRDVVDKNGMAEYEVDSDEEEEGEKDEDENNLKYPFEGLMIKKRNVYWFDRNLEGGKVNVEASDLGDIGEVDSEQDKKDMAMLDDVSDFKIIEDVTEKCTIMAPLTVEPTKKKRKKKN
ncbi:expressed unknown protein [Seminavis robusta]|uniref:Uncharacterized protein n=1 Tax=Seminavis robusta TaxID=568900 RepID=A0A9N8E0G6_9STRA|nr:expressed unknown protein [Seminavis robusta]|eukprot:Sro388_g132270.1 n/a (301) ;mRNA; f:15997-16899